KMEAAGTEVTYAVTGGNITFDTSTGTITDCDQSVTEAVIPDTIEGVSVTSIGDEAFFGCYSLSSIEIPTSVTSIGNGAFFGCGRLSSIDIPASVTNIGEHVFGNCDSLKSIEIPASVTSIEAGAFAYCNSLSNIN